MLDGWKLYSPNELGQAYLSVCSDLAYAQSHYPETQVCLAVSPYIIPTTATEVDGVAAFLQAYRTDVVLQEQAFPDVLACPVPYRMGYRCDVTMP